MDIDLRIGDEKNGYVYYGELIIKREGKYYKYLFKYYEEHMSMRRVNTSTIGLIGAFDMTNNFGGYKMEVKGMRNLVEIFEKEFIMKLL